jgi:site-specific DNA-methyltransferase (adenine-specific)
LHNSTIVDLTIIIANEHPENGGLITLDPPCRDMITASPTAGFYKSEFWQKSYPRLQILTIEQILAKVVVQMPPETGTFIAAQKVKAIEGFQEKMDM